MRLDARADHGGQRERPVLVDLLPRLDPSQAQEVEDELVEPVGLLLDLLEEPGVDIFVVQRPFEEGLGIRLDRGKRGLQLV